MTTPTFKVQVLTGLEILKQPLQTCVTIDVLDFEEFHVEERVHIGISVKDFKSIVLHAETLKARVSALYSHPTRPMQLGYSEHGMNCAFTLMTIGDYRGGSVTPAPAVARNTSVTPSARTNPQQASAMQRSFQDHQQGRNNSMPPPMQKAPRNFTREPASQRPPRPSPPPPKASVDEESLFISMDDDDRKWGERNFDEDDFEDTLGWDPNANNVRTSFPQPSNSTLIKNQGTASAGLSNLKYRKTVSSLRFHDDKPVAPTQRLSQVQKLSTQSGNLAECCKDSHFVRRLRTIAQAYFKEILELNTKLYATGRPQAHHILDVWGGGEPRHLHDKPAIGLLTLFWLLALALHC